MAKAKTLVTLDQKLDELREYGEGLGLSDDEINACLLEILKSEKSEVDTGKEKAGKRKKKRGCVRSTCRVMVGCFLAFVALIATLIALMFVSDGAARYIDQAIITPVIYPALRIVRFFGLFLMRTLDRDFIDYYDADCLIDNPFYTNEIDPHDCEFCKNMTEVKVMTNLTRKEFKDSYANQGTLLLVKDGEDATLSLPQLQQLCLAEMHKIRAGANQFQFSEGSGLTGMDGFFKGMTEKQVLADKKFHALWFGRRMGPGQMLRTYFPRPYFIKSKVEVMQHRKVFIDNPASPSYEVHISSHNTWYVQSWGQRTLVFTPQGSCPNECKTHRLTVSSGDLVYWSEIYWTVNSEPSPPAEDGHTEVSISLLGAFS